MGILVALLIIVSLYSAHARIGMAIHMDQRGALEVPDTWIDATSPAIEWDYWCTPTADWKETHALSITLNDETVFKNRVGSVGLGPVIFETTRLIPGEYRLSIHDGTRDQSVSATFSSPQTVEIHITVEPLTVMTCTNECPGSI